MDQPVSWFHFTSFSWLYLCISDSRESALNFFFSCNSNLFYVERNFFKMSKNCHCDRERDLNNNYVGYSNGCLAANANNNNRNSSASTISATNTIVSNNNNNNITNSTTIIQGPKITQIQAKVMFGSIGAIKELREKEHAEKARSTQAGRRH